MFLSLSQKIIVILISLFSANLCYSKSYNNIVCPTPNMIHQIADRVDSADFVNNTYIAYSSTWTLHTNNIHWVIIVYNVTAHSHNEAILAGKTSVRSITSQDNPNPENLAGTYMCNYDHGKVLAMGGDAE